MELISFIWNTNSGHTKWHKLYSLLEQNIQDNLSGHLVRRGRRSVARHSPSLIPATENKQLPTRRCFVCSHTEKKIIEQDVNRDMNAQLVTLHFVLIHAFVFIWLYTEFLDETLTFENTFPGLSFWRLVLKKNFCFLYKTIKHICPQKFILSLNICELIEKVL